VAAEDGIAIFSDPGRQTDPGRRAQRQMFHKDFNPSVIQIHRAAQVELHETPTYPWTLLTFLSGPGSIYFILTSGKVVKVTLRQGAGVLFRGEQRDPYLSMIISHED
jgi:hypothetical protein